LISLGDEQKVAWLERVDRETRKLDPRVVRVMASLHAVHETILIATSDGALAADVRPLVRMNVSGDRRAGWPPRTGYSGAGGRYTLAELVAGERPLELAREAVRQALVNLEAVNAPAGTMTVCSAPAGPASCCTRPSATGSKATSTARAPRPSAAASASAWRAPAAQRAIIGTAAAARLATRSPMRR